MLFFSLKTVKEVTFPFLRCSLSNWAASLEKQHNKTMMIMMQLLSPKKLQNYNIGVLKWNCTLAETLDFLVFMLCIRINWLYICIFLLFLLQFLGRLSFYFAWLSLSHFFKNSNCTTTSISDRDPPSSSSSTFPSVPVFDTACDEETLVFVFGLLFVLLLFSISVEKRHADDFSLRRWCCCRCVERVEERKGIMT